jgi:hypothetical protein
VDEGSWDLDYGLDGLLVRDILPRIGRRDLFRALLAVEDDPRALTGAGRWLFGEGKLETLDGPTLREVLEPIARRALAHPRRINRQRTILALGRSRKRTARKLLEEVVEGTIEIRPLRPEAAREMESPAFWQEALPGVREESDAALASEALKSR